MGIAGISCGLYSSYFSFKFVFFGFKIPNSLARTRKLYGVHLINSSAISTMSFNSFFVNIVKFDIKGGNKDLSQFIISSRLYLNKDTKI